MEEGIKEYIFQNIIWEKKCVEYFCWSGKHCWKLMIFCFLILGSSLWALVQENIDCKWFLCFKSTNWALLLSNNGFTHWQKIISASIVLQCFHIYTLVKGKEVSLFLTSSSYLFTFSFLSSTSCNTMAPSSVQHLLCFRAKWWVPTAVVLFDLKWHCLYMTVSDPIS